MHPLDVTSNLNSQPRLNSESRAHLLNGPPSLNYSLHHRKKSIVITWTIISCDSCILPITLYYVLWFGTTLSHNMVFTIMTAAFGVPTIVNFSRRMYYLLKRDPICRPIGSKRGWLDFFQISFAICFILVTVQIVMATLPEEPIVPLVAQSTSTVMFIVGGEVVISFFMCLVGTKTPFRVSSLPAGTKTRPALYTIIEDIVGVDGGGGRPFREALNVRYEASPLFRRMLHRLNAFWGFGAVTVAGAVTTVLWTIPEEIGYGIGWAVPFIWAAVWTVLTIRYVRSCLVEERAAWRIQRMDDNNMPLIDRSSTSTESTDEDPYESYEPMA